MSERIITTGEQLINLVKSHRREAQKMKKIPLVVIAGPTASGKTGLGIALAQAFDGEIVSADSRQIYREMAIGTACPTPGEQKLARHYLVDFVAPDQEFNLADYQKMAVARIKDINQRGKLPLLVGGTGLYISAVTENYLLPEAGPDLDLREKMETLAREDGKDAVHRILQGLDPQGASSIHPHNLRYVIRAIELASKTKQVKDRDLTGSPFHPLFITIDWPREELYRRIEERIDRQVEQGLLQETQKLLDKYDFRLSSLSSLGYREIGQYLRGETALTGALDLFKQKTRNYAKRQLTWFRKFPQVYSIPGEQLNSVLKELPAGLTDKK